MSQPLIKIHDLNKYFPIGDSGQLHVLKDINIEIHEGNFVSIMGPSGSGKSTLVNILGFLDNDFEGEYNFEGQSIEERSDNEITKLRNQKVGFVFQNFKLIENMTVLDNVRLPLLYAGIPARETKKRAQEALDAMEIGDKGGTLPNKLSGGQRQRVAIARALINNPRFIIADEPTGALDTKTSATIMEILARLNKEDGVTIVMVTHDPGLQRYANQHIVIVDGRVHETDPVNAEDMAKEFYRLSQIEGDE